jgi:HNH endonuclease
MNFNNRINEYHKDNNWNQFKCIEWSGTLNNGYPVKSIDGKQKRINREMLAGHLGRELKPGYYACHRCDNPPCVNPSHLFEGTHLDNMRDCMNKGRNAKGSRSGNAKLNEYKVVEIRGKHSNGIRVKDLADEYNVSISAISNVIKYETWKHVKTRYRNIDVRFFRLSSFLSKHYKISVDGFE